MQEDRPTQYVQQATLPQAVSARRSPVATITIGALSLGVVAFGGLAALGFWQASQVRADVNAITAKAVASAKDEQKKADALAAEQAAESPYRSYIAPIEYGSFEIKFPKSWSAEVAESRTGSTQVNLIVHPEMIRTQNGILDPQAGRVTLNQKTLEETVKAYDKVKGLKRSETTVSGIPSVEYNGTFSDKRTQRMVIVPIRDKTLVLTNENATYKDQFEQIVRQSHVNP